MRGFRAMLACAVAAMAVAGCGSHEAKLADTTTRAVYDNNVDGVTANFTTSLRQEVTRAQVGALSDMLHQHGDYKGVTETGSEPDGAYDFRADFTNGSLMVKLKVDNDGRIAGYRIIEGPQNASSSMAP